MNDNMLNNSVSIALCTFEGSKYLKKQLESIAKQSVRPAELIICDDASTDLTPAVIEGFSEKAIFPVKYFRNEVRLGVVGNFSRALSLCNGEYIALSDQDDIWLPNRLEITLKSIKEVEKEFGAALPLLIHTDLSIIDEDAKSMAPSFMSLRRIKHYDAESLNKLLMQNFVTGSTVLINRPLMEASLPIPDEAVMHDWWLALVAAAVGKVIFINQPTVLYRQHEANVVGAEGFLTLVNLKKIFDLKTREKEIAEVIKQAIVLYDHLEKIKYSDIPRWLPEYLCDIKLGGIKAVNTANKHNILKQGLIRNILNKLMLLKGDYRNYLINSDRE